jgi:hypothetical protein
MEFPIVGHWGHSFEEDSAGVRAYRPWQYAFPRARGRGSMEFLPDGSLIDRPVGAGDARQDLRGRWEYAGSGVFRVTYDDPSRPGWTFEIIECNDQVLRIR